MQKLKVATIVGTRPEIIRLSRVLTKLDQYTEHRLIHTGQNYDYELNEIFFRDLDLRMPEYFLGAAGATAAETIGKVISEVDKVLESEKPEAVLILGDTNSCLAAIPAKRRKIPVFHMEAGNRCFDFRVPEEINRRIVDHISDINMPYSDIAREYLLREGMPPDRVIKTGSPMYEVLQHSMPRIVQSTVVAELGLQPFCYFLVSAHREENVDEDGHLANLVEVLNTLARNYGLPVLVSTHPRTRKRFEAQGAAFDPLVQLMKPWGFVDYVHLEMNAKAVLSDSGTITEESSILNFPALNIRDAHERPEGMEQASVMLTGLNPGRVLQALELLMDQPRGEKRLLLPVSDYSMPNVSDKVVRIILSYTDYVKRTVWSQH